mgnify:CR=1 FL=1
MDDALIALWLSADAWIVWRLLRASRIHGSPSGRNRDAAPDAWRGEDGPVSRSFPIIQTPVPHGIAGEVFQPRLASDGADHTT